MAKEIRIIEVKELQSKTDGRKFTVYKTVDKNQRKMDVKFTRDCKNIPVKPCTIVVNDADCNVDASRQWPCLWVKNVVKIIDNAVKENNVMLFLDVKEIDDLPF